MCADVFISYSSADYEVAQEVEKSLESSGLSVFDTHEIAAGSTWVTNLDEAFNSSKALIALISNNYSSSPYTTSEWSAAISRGKPVVPVVIERGARVPAVLAPYIGIDVSQPETRQAKLQLLARQLAKLTSVPSESTADQMNSMKSHLIETRLMQYHLSEPTISPFQRILPRTAAKRRILIISLLMVQVAFTALIVESTRPVQGWVSLVIGVGASLVSVFIGYYVGSRHRRPDDEKDATRSHRSEARQ